MPELTEEMRRELRASGDAPLRLTDPETGHEYVVLRADVFDHLKDSTYDDSEWTDEEMDRLAAESMNQIMAEDDKNDPYLQSYQDA